MSLTVYLSMFVIVLVRPCITNEWKCDFWHPRCLLYQIKPILIHLLNIENFYSKHSHEIQHKAWNISFETYWTPCKKPHISKWPRSNKYRGGTLSALSYNFYHHCCFCYCCYLSFEVIPTSKTAIFVIWK